MRIYEFVWNQNRIEHIARHGVVPEEVEEACFGLALVQRTGIGGSQPGLLCAWPDRSWAIFILRYYSTSRGHGISSNSAIDDRQRKAAIQAVEEPMNREIIPQTDSIKELAEFWDSHDLTDFEDQLEEVKEKVFERQEALVQIRLGTHEVELVKILAKSRGIDYTDLIREWVLEKL